MQTAELEKDLSYFHSLYSPLSARILGIVIAEVNRVSYPHSFLFDEYPDALTLERMAGKIMHTVDSTLRDGTSQEEDPPFFRDPAMEQMEPTAGNNPDGMPWLMLLIKALLFDEIIQLRRRHRG